MRQRRWAHSINNVTETNRLSTPNNNQIKMKHSKQDLLALKIRPIFVVKNRINRALAITACRGRLVSQAQQNRSHKCIWQIHATLRESIDSKNNNTKWKIQSIRFNNKSQFNLVDKIHSPLEAKIHRIFRKWFWVAMKKALAAFLIKSGSWKALWPRIHLTWPWLVGWIRNKIREIWML